MKVDQRILTEDGDVGDCFVACLATILGVDYQNIPHFVKDSEDSWFQDFRVWLEKKHSMSAVLIRLNDLEDGMPITYPQGLFIMTGVSPRSDPEDEVPIYHAVVFRGSALGWKMYHDPHSSRNGVSTFRSAIVFTKILEPPAEDIYPEYVQIETTDCFLALSESMHKGTIYYRPAGRWGVTFKANEEEELVVTEFVDMLEGLVPFGSTRKRLEGRRLLPATWEQYLEDNKGHI